jgi:hypothetical protein
LEPPDWLDELAGPVGTGEAGQPLPVDPFPDWALFIAA